MEEIEQQLFSKCTYPSSICDLGAHSTNAVLEKWTRILDYHAPISGVAVSRLPNKVEKESLTVRTRIEPTGRFVINYRQNPTIGPCRYGWAFVSNRTRVRRCENKVVTPSFADWSLRRSTGFVYCTQEAIIAMRAIGVWVIQVNASFHIRLKELLLKWSAGWDGHTKLPKPARSWHTRTNYR